MSTNEETTTSKPSGNDAAKQAATLVDTLFDLGTAWADYAIGYGKFALESSSRVLGETAKALDAIQHRIRGEETPKAS